jgi:hypothetical protein
MLSPPGFLDSPMKVPRRMVLKTSRRFFSYLSFTYLGFSLTIFSGKFVTKIQHCPVRNLLAGGKKNYAKNNAWGPFIA